MIRGDASEIHALAADLAAVPAKIPPALRPALQSSAEKVKTAWQANARATSGAHGKHYPNSITAEVRALGAALAADIGPDSSKLQGGMGPGFEFGSRNQPPHLDGVKALEATQDAIGNSLNDAIARLMP